MIVFRPKLDEVDSEHPEFSLVLSKKQNYDIVRFDLYTSNTELNPDT